MLLSSEKFKQKAEEIVKEGVENKCIVAVEKITEGKKSSEHITLETPKSEEGGMMLYTSGTTSRPASISVRVFQTTPNNQTERRCTPSSGPYGAIDVFTPSLALLPFGSTPPLSTPPSYPRGGERPSDATYRWLSGRIRLSLQRAGSMGTTCLPIHGQGRWREG